MGTAPPSLGTEQERPFTGDAPQGWTENYALAAHDPAAKVGLLFCTGSQPFDRSLWHEFLQVGLPGGRSLCWKSAGRSADETGPGAALSRWRCEEPGAEWRFEFSGFGRVVETESLAAGPLADGPWTRADLDLTFEAAGPPWILGGETLEKASETSGTHYEQVGRVSGEISIGSDRIAFDGGGLRDHSRGPRDFASVLDHAWCDCLFPSGRFFALYRMRLPDGSDGVAAGCIGDGTTVVPVEVASMPLLDEDEGARERYEIVLEGPEGSERIGAEVIAPLGTTSYMTPGWMGAGLLDADAVTQIVVDGTTRFTWDGEEGFGHTQRSRAPESRRPRP